MTFDEPRGDRRSEPGYLGEMGIGAGLRFASLGVLVALAAACGDDSVTPTGGAPAGGSDQGGAGGEAPGAGGVGGEGGGGGSTEVTWGACEIDAYLDECATFEVPLDHTGVDEGTISFHVSRSLGTDSGPRKTVWMLNGGPGGSGAGWTGYVELLREVMGEGWDFYAVDHRGTGLSTLLCPDQEGDGELRNNEYDPCVNHLLDNPELPRNFTATQASYDVLWAIDHTLAPGDEAYLFGYSYGAYWGIRTAQLGRDKLAGAILGGIPAPGRMWFAEWDLNVDDAGQRLAQYCIDEARCSAEMGGDPWARLGEAFTQLEAGHCSEAGLDTDTLHIMLNWSLDEPDLRSLVFPIIRRYLRCNADDVAALNEVRQAIGDDIGFPLGATPFTSYSTILHYNVTLSELLMDPEAPYTSAETQAFYDASYFGSGFAPFYIQTAGVWPLYERDDAVEATLDPSLPLLMVNGELDARTIETYARQFADENTGPAQSYFEIPFGSHGIGSDCEIGMYVAFLEDPTAEVDASCLADLPSFTTEVAQDFALAWMGTTDLWGGDVVPLSAEARSALRRSLPRTKNRIPFGFR